MCSNCAIVGKDGTLVPVQCGCGTFGVPCGCDNGNRMPNDTCANGEPLCGSQGHVPYNRMPEGQVQADTGDQPDVSFQPTDPSGQIPDTTSGFSTDPATQPVAFDPTVGDDGQQSAFAQPDATTSGDDPQFAATVSGDGQQED